jgi:4-amino-4-deoxy-L-arabinose transferase-like glycosyltransferase
MTNDLETRTRVWLSSRAGAQIAGAVLLAALALVLFANLRVEPVGRSSEKRAMLVARHMVESGDWLVPMLQNKPRLQKPPLLYWLGATIAEGIGDTGPIAVRLPSALACLGLVALVIGWAGSLGGAARGLVAGALLTAMMQLTTSGRRGDAEMLLAFLSVASLVVFDRLHATQRRALLPLFGVLAGLAILTKATAVLLVVALPIAVFLALERELRRLLDWGVAGACALALAIGLSWYVALIAFVPGAFQSLLGDLVLPLGGHVRGHGNAGHFRPIFWYLGVLPTRAAPASLLLPLVLWRLYTTRVYRDAPRWRFAALCFLVPFVAFSLLPQKQDHYTLPMLPGLALVTAEALSALSAPVRGWLARGLGTALAAAGIGATVLIALFFAWIEGLSPLGVAAGAAAVAAIFAIALAAALRGAGAAFAAAWIPAFLLVLAAQRGVVGVRVARLEGTPLQRLSIPERQRLVETARAHPWFVDVFRLTSGGEED